MLDMKILYSAHPPPPPSVNFVSKHFGYYDLKECLGCGVPGAVGINQADPWPSCKYTDSLKHLSSSHLSPFLSPSSSLSPHLFSFLYLAQSYLLLYGYFSAQEINDLLQQSYKKFTSRTLFCAEKTLFLILLQGM